MARAPRPTAGLAWQALPRGGREVHLAVGVDAAKQRRRGCRRNGRTCGFVIRIPAGDRRGGETRVAGHVRLAVPGVDGV